jgi:hypothetical protein
MDVVKNLVAAVKFSRDDVYFNLKGEQFYHYWLPLTAYPFQASEPQ